MKKSFHHTIHQPPVVTAALDIQKDSLQANHPAFIVTHVNTLRPEPDELVLNESYLSANAAVVCIQ